MGGDAHSKQAGTPVCLVTPATNQRAGMLN